MNLETYLSEESSVVPFLQQYFKPSDELTIFDVGACEGEDSIRYARLFPNAIIHAFEPVPDNAEKARFLMQTYNVNNVVGNTVALSNQAGGVELFTSSGDKTHEWDYGNKSSSILKPKLHRQLVDYVRFDEGKQVVSDTIGFYCYRYELTQIDFLHMDVQGAELMVLDGAAEMIRNIKLIWMEVSKVELYAGQPLYNQVQEYMQYCGFELLLDEVGEVSGNQLWKNKKFIQ